MSLRMLSSLLALALCIAVSSVQAGAARDTSAVEARAIAAFNSKDYATAAKEFTKLKELYSKKEDYPNAQIAMERLGRVLLKQGRYEDAVAVLREALLLPEGTQATSTQIKKRLTQALSKAGHYASYVALLQERLAESPALPAAKQAKLHIQLGDGFKHLEVYDQAAAHYRKGLDLWKGPLKPELHRVILINIGHCESKLGHYQEALDAFSQVRAITKEEESPQSLAEIYSLSALIRMEQGDFLDAKEAIHQAQTIERRHDLKNNLGADRNNEGAFFRKVGLYSQARSAFSEAAALAGETGDIDSEAIATSNLGLIARLEGDYPKSRRLWESTLKMHESSGSKEGQAFCHAGLGDLYEYGYQDFAKAYGEYSKAMEIYSEIGRSTLAAEMLYHVARTLLYSAEGGQAARGLGHSRQTPAYVDRPREEMIQEAVGLLNQALETGERLKIKETIWSAHHLLGLAAFLQDKLPAAQEHYKTAIDMVIAINGAGCSGEMSDYLRDKKELFDEAISVLGALYQQTGDEGYIKRIIEYQQIFHNELIRASRTDNRERFENAEKRAAYQKLQQTLAEQCQLEKALARTGERRSATEDSGEKAALEILENKQTEQLEKQLAANNGELKQQISQWSKAYPNDLTLFDTAPTMDIDGIQKMLPSDTAILVYFPARDKVHIVAITHKKLEYRSSPMDQNEFAQDLIVKLLSRDIETALEGEIPSESPVLLARTDALLAKLYEKLIEPVEGVIAQVDKLIIVPNKIITSVPFAALVKVGEDGRSHYLIEHKTVAYSRLDYLQPDFSKERVLTHSDAVLAVANPVHEGLHMGPGLRGSIEGAETEIEDAGDIAQKHKSRLERLINNQATLESWKKKSGSGNYAVYYFATHGINAEDIRGDSDEYRSAFYTQAAITGAPSDSYLLMAQHKSDKDAGNGLLTIRSINTMDEKYFGQMQLALLSACNTAVFFSADAFNAGDPRCGGAAVNDAAAVRGVGSNSKRLRNPTDTAETASGGQALACNEGTGTGASSLRGAKRTASTASHKSDGIDELLSKIDSSTEDIMQLTLTDAFLRRGFSRVIGSFWKLPDDTTPIVMEKAFNNFYELDPVEALTKAQREYINDNRSDTHKVHPARWAGPAVYLR